MNRARSRPKENITGKIHHNRMQPKESPNPERERINRMAEKNPTKSRKSGRDEHLDYTESHQSDRNRKTCHKKGTRSIQRYKALALMPTKTSKPAPQRPGRHDTTETERPPQQGKKPPKNTNRLNQKNLRVIPRSDRNTVLRPRNPTEKRPRTNPKQTYTKEATKDKWDPGTITMQIESGRRPTKDTKN